MAEDFTVKGPSSMSGPPSACGSPNGRKTDRSSCCWKAPVRWTTLWSVIRAPNDLQMLTKLKGRVPVVSVVLRASAPWCLAAVFSDYVIMTANGLFRRATGQNGARPDSDRRAWRRRDACHHQRDGHEAAGMMCRRWTWRDSILTFSNRRKEAHWGRCGEGFARHHPRPDAAL